MSRFTRNREKARQEKEEQLAIWDKFYTETISALEEIRNNPQKYVDAIHRTSGRN